MELKTGNITTYWDIQNLSTKKTVEDVAKEFEAIFVRMILKEFRKTIPKGLLGNSFSSKMYLDMFDMTIAEKVSETDSFGLKNYIKEALENYAKYSGEKG
ncbi:MAG: flagellar biosynthesis protein FlgJ [Aquificota bacterium]|nr:MAG: flagellar biosynthesis protein FlgJ [Aquificota bacterium]